MPSRPLVWAILLAGFFPSAARAADDDRIDQLIRQLGSARFADRESATQALQQIGGLALPALKKSAASNLDAA